MALNVIRGRRRTAVRGVIYGVEGIGKSTLAASFPAAVVLDTEDGTNHLDVARIPCGDWATLKANVHQLGIERHEFQTVVIDTADWAERSLVEWMLARDNKKSIEAYGFGKGYVLLAEEFGHLLTACDKLVARGPDTWQLVSGDRQIRLSPTFCEANLGATLRLRVAGSP